MSEGFGSLRGSTEWSLQEGTEKIKKKKKKKRRGGTTLKSKVTQLSNYSLGRAVYPQIRQLPSDRNPFYGLTKAIVKCPHYGIKEPKMPLQSDKLRITKSPKPIPDNSYNGCYCSSWKTTEMCCHFDVYSSVIKRQGISLFHIQQMENVAPNQPPSHQSPPQAQPAIPNLLTSQDWSFSCNTWWHQTP